MRQLLVGMAFALVLATAVGYQDSIAPVAAGGAWVATLEDERQLAEFEEKATAAGALGFYRDEATSSLVVLVPATRQAEFRLDALGPRPVPVTIKISDIEPRDLEVADGRFHALPTSGIPALKSFAYSFDARLEKIKLTTPMDDDLLSNYLGDSWPFIDYHYGEVESVSCFRGDDCSPFKGGAAIHEIGSPNYFDCTTGFAVVNSNDQRGLVTAAHCEIGTGEQASKFETPFSKRLVGQTASGSRHCDDGISDVLVIAGQSYTNKIWIGTTSGTGTQYVESAANPVVGSKYRYSGAASAENSNQLVEALNGQIFHQANWCTGAPGGFWTVGLIRFSRSGACDAIKGDSGAPFYFRYNALPTPVYIRGMVIARTPTDCFAMKYTKIRDVTGYSIYAP